MMILFANSVVVSCFTNKKGFSQEELSYKTELDISQIGRIERGKVNTSVSVQYKIAVALDVSLKDLFDFE